MATGFECEFAEKVSKGIQAECPICLLVLREPYQATCCGKSFCRRCIRRIKASKKTCPTCNDKNFTLFPNKGLQQSLFDFEVYCTHKSKGCEWTGELRELDNHLNSDPPVDKALQGCPYTPIKCPLGCAGCKKVVYRKDVKAHVNDKLLGHVVMHNAQMKSVKQQLQGVNTQFVMQNAQIKSIKQQLQDVNTQFVVQNAQMKSIKQQLQGVNTQFEMKLEKIKESLEQRVAQLETKVSEGDKQNTQLTTQLTTRVKSIEGDKQYLEQRVFELEEKVVELEKKSRVLSRKNRELESEVKTKQPMNASKSQPGRPSLMQQAATHISGTYKPFGAEFTMTNFEERRRDGYSWFSPHFYTHPNGYKMCLRVDANGNGPGKGTHLSVAVCLMRGEFDDQLKWPFRGEVMIKLLNQEEDKDHIVDVVSYAEAPDNSCQRVTIGNRNIPLGFGDFLPHTELQPKYLKNDHIKLCIKRVAIF